MFVDQQKTHFKIKEGFLGSTNINHILANYIQINCNDIDREYKFADKWLKTRYTSIKTLLN